MVRLIFFLLLALLDEATEHTEWKNNGNYGWSIEHGDASNTVQRASLHIAQSQHWPTRHGVLPSAIFPQLLARGPLIFESHPCSSISSALPTLSPTAPGPSPPYDILLFIRSSVIAWALPWARQWAGNVKINKGSPCLLRVQNLVEQKDKKWNIL